MPLKSISLTSSLNNKIQKKISSFVKEGILPVSFDPDELCFPCFAMYIQLVPKKQAGAYSFGKPEGVRVFIQSGKNVIAALDFLFSAKTLRFLHIHQGRALHVLINSLNKLDRKYSQQKATYHVELISFLFTPGLFFLVRSTQARHFYYGTAKRLSTLSEKQLVEQVEAVMIEQINSFHTQ